MKLSSWFDIDSVKYAQYLFEGYSISHDEKTVRWTLNQKLHRTDGPAVIRADGTQEWWVDGHRFR
jgi:hypothetical protein